MTSRGTGASKASNASVQARKGGCKRTKHRQPVDTRPSGQAVLRLRLRQQAGRASRSAASERKRQRRGGCRPPCTPPLGGLRPPNPLPVHMRAKRRWQKQTRPSLATAQLHIRLSRGRASAPPSDSTDAQVPFPALNANGATTQLQLLVARHTRRACAAVVIPGVIFGRHLP